MYRIVLCIALLWTFGCNKGGPAKDTYDMGEKVRMGSLTYNVIEAKWKSQLGEGMTARLPDRNFLLVKISVTNGGANEKSIPAFALDNSNGDSYTESSDGKGVDGWMGVIRRVQSSSTEEGWVLFDVPTNSYTLRLGDPDNPDAREALIKIPLQLAE